MISQFDTSVIFDDVLFQQFGDTVFCVKIITKGEFFHILAISDFFLVGLGTIKVVIEGVAEFVFLGRNIKEDFLFGAGHADGDQVDDKIV